MQNIITIIFLTLFFSFNVFSGEVVVTAKIKPVGFLEIKSSKLLGRVLLNKEAKTYSSEYIFVPITSLESSISLRDSHIHEYLKASEFKNLYMKNVLITNTGGSGDLTINGISRKVDFTVSTKKGMVITSFKVKLSDFSLEIPSFMGTSIADEVDITTSYPAKYIEVEL